MPKPDPALLNPARYPFSCTIDPRFGDLDVNMHINNVAMAGMIEDGRVRFHHKVGYRILFANLKSMVAGLQIDYLGEGNYPDPVTVHCAIEEIGRTSHHVVSLLGQGERLICFARSTVVAVGSDGPCALPEQFRASMGAWMLGA